MLWRPCTNIQAFPGFHSLNCSLNRSIIHLHTLSPTHSLTHPPIHPLSLTRSVPPSLTLCTVPRSCVRAACVLVMSHVPLLARRSSHGWLNYCASSLCLLSQRCEWPNTQTQLPVLHKALPQLTRRWVGPVTESEPLLEMNPFWQESKPAVSHQLCTAGVFILSGSEPCAGSVWRAEGEAAAHAGRHLWPSQA